MKKAKLVLGAGLIGIAMLLGCAGLKVMQVNSTQNPIRDVCIKPTPKQPVPEFLALIQRGFARHGIATKIMEQPRAGKATLQQIFSQCEYSLTYFANMQRNDSSLQVDSVHLSIYHWDVEIGYADRDLPKGFFGGPGLDVTHWDSAASKIDPMIDSLLGGFPVVASTNAPMAPIGSVYVPDQHW